MAMMNRASMLAVAIFALVLAAVSFPAVADQAAPAPSPTATSDGTSIDQGIAYLLMLLALVLTYIIH
nr:arabinogalactan peptide 20-like [Ipomoea trifida]GMC58239.1 arabinogalactan peptide 20-like [Ipomoea batatas]GMC64782.1 arabinogalactan peptide 20-like [Ipomoea batatas]GMC68426.1 arabinogalactan peptide 20-like [Ipomoea batatas]